MITLPNYLRDLVKSEASKNERTVSQEIQFILKKYYTVTVGQLVNAKKWDRCKIYKGNELIGDNMKGLDKLRELEVKEFKILRGKEYSEMYNVNINEYEEYGKMLIIIV
jgi:hypothetical protein